MYSPFPVLSRGPAFTPAREALCRGKAFFFRHFFMWKSEQMMLANHYRIVLLSRSPRFVWRFICGGASLYDELPGPYDQLVTCAVSFFAKTAWSLRNKARGFPVFALLWFQEEISIEQEQTTPFQSWDTLSSCKRLIEHSVYVVVLIHACSLANIPCDRYEVWFLREPSPRANTCVPFTYP